MIGSYIFRMPANEHVKPFAMFGGGMVRFSPNNDNNAAGIPSAVTKPGFVYGFGSDFKFSDHWGFRLQYRGLVRTSPDYKLSSSDPTNTFGTGLKSNIAEPSIQLVYHF
jgi:opacity protein-like surface antigen